MNSYKEFKTLSASNSWAQAHHLTWYTNFVKGSGYNPLDGLKEYGGNDVKYVITKVGKTYQLFYKE